MPITMTYETARVVQAVIFDGGFAGIAVPTEYGGCGLTLEHQKAWADVVRGYQVPVPLFVSIGILGSTLLDHGSQELKRRYLPRILRGDEVWIQLLSEPSGGSDMGAVMTRAMNDGQTWILNGGKIWTTHADKADYGMCLARTDWEQTKYRGLTMFAVPFAAAGVTVEPIVGQEGDAHFCQEFFDDVVLPDSNVIGEPNDGWRVAHTLLEHEHDATAGVGFGLGLGGGGQRNTETETGVGDLVDFARRGGTVTTGATCQLLAEAYVNDVVMGQANRRIESGTSRGILQGDWGALLKLGLGLQTLRRGEIAIAVAGARGVIWDEQDEQGSEPGRQWLTARQISIAAGTNEMQRNTVSERLLGMPREPATDRDVPFSEVVRRRHPPGAVS
jgi:alkylation response protein AidB-like acyl-CoA dehydrogenase